VLALAIVFGLALALADAVGALELDAEVVAKGSASTCAVVGA